jgi:hypothetical protein
MNGASLCGNSAWQSFSRPSLDSSPSMKVIVAAEHQKSCVEVNSD